MRKLIALTLAVMTTVGVAYVMWSQNRRIGSGFVNRVIDPLLLERGLSGAGRSEIGTLEHIGRRSGTPRLTPVHPVPTERGFRIIVPLGGASEWARNVLAAGHCRLQLHDVVHELDEPALVKAAAVPGLPAIARRISSWLGFRYLLLHRLSSAPGSLAEPTVPLAEAMPVPEEQLVGTEAIEVLVAYPSVAQGPIPETRSTAMRITQPGGGSGIGGKRTSGPR